MSTYEILKQLNADKLYEDGKTLKDIATLAKVGVNAVSLFLKKSGVKTRPTGNPVPVFKIGELVGNWEVLSEDTKKNKSGTYLQLSRCIRCGHEAEVDLVGAKRRGADKCFKCKSSKTFKEDGNTDFNYLIEVYFKTLVKNLKRRDHVSKLEFDIDLNYLIELMNKQNKMCAVSGISLDNNPIKLADVVMSLDRIDSNKGYIKGNVQWRHKHDEAILRFRLFYRNV
jgi:predicted Zn-ribbon and HTH transcriptional regulator